MTKKQENKDPEIIRAKLVELLNNFEHKLSDCSLRKKVQALVPAFRHLRDLGCSLISSADALSARDRILHYLLKYPRTVILGDELMVVSGIQEYARRIRELRVQFGWKIYTGLTMMEMTEEVQDNSEFSLYRKMKPDEYVLADEKEDLEAARRWFIANDIRKKKLGTRDKILNFLKENVGKPVTGEELRYVSGGKTEWARRIRELRTEYGWSVQSKMTGRPDFPVGTYILESLKQLPEHDRAITDIIRCKVLERDKFMCHECNWNYEKDNPADPRKHLELHHINHHACGGKNTIDNLITLCNVCHDKKHSKEI